MIIKAFFEIGCFECRELLCFNFWIRFIQQGLLERNEMRNKALGITPSKAKVSAPSPKKSIDKENKRSESNPRITEMTRKSLSSPQKSSTSNEMVRATLNKTPLRTVSSKTNKDDADVAVEINITSNQNIQVRNFTIEWIRSVTEINFSSGWSWSCWMWVWRWREDHSQRRNSQLAVQLRKREQFSEASRSFAKEFESIGRFVLGHGSDIVANPANRRKLLRKKRSWYV